MPKTKQSSARLLSVDEAAARLTVSRRTVFAWIAAGRLRATRLGRRTTRIRGSEIDRLLAEAESSA